MKILVNFGGIRFRFDTDCDIIVEESIAPFFCTGENVIDVNIRLIHDFSKAPLPSTPMLGEDLLQEFYRERCELLCLTKSGQGKYLACCVCDESCRDMTCYLNFPSGSPVDTLGNLLRMIPLRRILLHHGVLFFHASQVAMGSTGILFTAPSQTGKTTQSRLWQAHRGARILCNDRTLTDCAKTYGFPVDGSEPIRSSEICSLGALVVLEQAPENSARRLSARAAIPRLMTQLVLDVWDPDAVSIATRLLLLLVARTPVYLLRCTPDEGAVRCLEQLLRSDGVISYE